MMIRDHEPNVRSRLIASARSMSRGSGASGTIGWRRSLVGVLFALVSICHGSLIATAADEGSAVERFVEISGDGGSPVHATECSIEGLLAARLNVQGESDWVGQLVGDPVSLSLPPVPILDAQVPGSTLSPGTRRALLQVFLI